MVTVVAFAYYQYYVPAAIRTAVHLHVVETFLQSYQLLGSKFIGINAECQSVYRQILHAVMFLREFVFHIADVVIRHQFHEQSFVFHTH